MSDIITLDMNTPSVQYLCRKDKRLAKVINMVGSISYTTPDGENAYSFLIHEVIEQMLSIKAGKKIYERLVDLCNDDVTPFKMNQLSDEQIKSIGTSNSKVRYIRSITDAVINGTLNFEKLHCLSANDALHALTKIQGIGKWTAKMYLIFVLDRQDILPYEDVAFLQTYRWVYKTDVVLPEYVKKKCSKWKPYSSIAARFFYKALDEGMTKEEFHLYK